MKIEKYEHHGVEVSVISNVKGRHREHCLCWQKCKYFKPNTPGNCPIAQSLYNLCVENKVTTPVFECKKYELEERTDWIPLSDDYPNHDEWVYVWNTKKIISAKFEFVLPYHYRFIDDNGKEVEDVQKWKRTT